LANLQIGSELESGGLELNIATIAMSSKQRIDAKERKLRTEVVHYGFASVRMEGLEVLKQKPLPIVSSSVNCLTRNIIVMRKLGLDIVRNGH